MTKAKEPGDVIGWAIIVEKTNRKHGNNRVYTVKCRRCNNLFERPVHKLTATNSHFGCFKWGRAVARDNGWAFANGRRV